MQDENYRSRVAIERENYENTLNVHALPDIFHYWSNAYVRPKLEALGIGSSSEMFSTYLEEQCERRKTDAKRFVSIGSGNCDLEIELALRLTAKGHTDFVIDCLDLNADMLDRGYIAATKQGVADQLHFVQADVNEWSPTSEYDAVIANQALHHVLKLENLFGHIKSFLKPDGAFLISDIIGRNGHLRWPEALDIVHEFWPRLPPSYRYNRQLQRYEEMFDDWDCSRESFEGIRSQDILPLLLDQFCFHVFFGFANVIEPFVDRNFGPNFDATGEWDRAFIDEVNRRDEAEINSGRIKPTHMLAVLRNKPASRLIFQEPLTPDFCLRSPAAHHAAAEASLKQLAYQTDAWPYELLQREVVIVCGWLKESEKRIKDLQNELKRVNQLFPERTAWALQLDTEVEQLYAQLGERTAWAQRLDTEVRQLYTQLDQRTAWALQLKAEGEQWSAQAGQLNAQVEERTAWAQRLDTELEQSNALAQRLAKELEERTAWALQLDQELKSLSWARRIDRYLRKIFPRR